MNTPRCHTAYSSHEWVFRNVFCSRARGCRSCHRERSTNWRASISSFACLTGPCHRVAGQACILADLRQRPVGDGNRTSLFPSLIGPGARAAVGRSPARWRPTPSRRGRPAPPPVRSTTESSLASGNACSSRACEGSAAITPSWPRRSTSPRPSSKTLLVSAGGVWSRG
jgi:hypothetical protein